MMERRLTPEEYLAREATMEFKSEYFAGELFAIPAAAKLVSQLRVTPRIAP